MNKNESISVLKRFTVIMLALLMTAACLPVMEGRAVYADNKDLVNVTEEQAESLGIEYAEGLQFTKEDVEELKKADLWIRADGRQKSLKLNEETGTGQGDGTENEGEIPGESGEQDPQEAPAEAYLDVQYDKSTGIAVVSGDMRETPGSFYSLWVDDDRLYDVDIDGLKSFEGVEIDMKEYSVGMHKIGAVLYDEDGNVKWYDEDILYFEDGVPTDIYSSQKPSIKTDYVSTGAKKMKYYYVEE